MKSEITEMRLLFLDVDGVLNNHIPLENGYCTLYYDKVQLMNKVLDYFPGMHIVLSSA